MERSHSTQINFNINQNLNKLEKKRHNIKHRLKSNNINLYDINCLKTNSTEYLFKDFNASQKLLMTINTKNKFENFFTARSSDSRELCQTCTLTTNQSTKCNNKKTKINKNLIKEISALSSQINDNSTKKNSQTIENEHRQNLPSLTLNNNNINSNKSSIKNLNTFSNKNENNNFNTINYNIGQIFRKSIPKKFDIFALKRRVSQFMSEFNGNNQFKHKHLIHHNIGRNNSIKNNNSSVVKDYNSKIGKKKFKGIKIISSENNLPKDRPTNNIQMNKLIINCFKHDNGEFAQKLYNLNEKYFSILEKMKISRTQMLIDKFEELKKSYNQNEKISEATIKNRNKENVIKKWEKHFMLHEYRDKIPEKEYKKFQIENNKKQEMKILETSKKLSELLFKMDAEEYEIPNKKTNLYKSTGSLISIKNFQRINRLKKIMDTIEDDEELGNYVIKVNKLKSEKKIQENNTIQMIKVLGTPRFIKTVFKPSTLKKYNELTSDHFGIPA